MNTPDPESLAIELSETIVEEYRYTYEQVAHMTSVSVTLIERFVSLNLIEAEDAKLRERDVARIARMSRLRRDLGLNWVGSSMVLDLSQEIVRLKARLRAYESHRE
ncbi:chaperone modulator CbpM [Pannus brasiliensis CCIBt3594]|uniref:Chaperone modulator CbpM n=1 Tax=Pannus brasiliensis CCIBt3594 TaxID=1427578 RepID=A0AAW9QZS7_9CHRO